MNKEIIFRAHPVFMLFSLKKLAFVLVLPVIKGAAQMLLYRRVTDVFLLEGAALAAAAALAYLRFRRFRAAVSGKTLTVEDGLFIRKKAVIPVNNISRLLLTGGFLLDTFGAAAVEVNTGAHARKSARIRFALYKTDAAAFERAVFGGRSGGGARISPLRIALFSATSSSALGGLTAVVPLADRALRLLGTGLYRTLSDITAFSRRFMTFFPPAVNAATALLAVFYAGAFLFSLARNARFFVDLSAESAAITYGVLVRRKRILRLSRVKAFRAERSLLMRPFGLYALFVRTGDRDKKSGRVALLPAARKGDLTCFVARAFPSFAEKTRFIRCKSDGASKIRLFAPPAVLSVIIICISAFFARTLPRFCQLTVFIAAAALAFIILYVLLRVLSLERRGVSFGKVFTVKDISGFCERELYLKATDAEVKLTRAPADRRYGACRVTVKAISGNADGARVRFLPYGETRRGFCDIYGIKPR